MRETEPYLKDTGVSLGVESGDRDHQVFQRNRQPGIRHLSGWLPEAGVLELGPRALGVSLPWNDVPLSVKCPCRDHSDRKPEGTPLFSLLLPVPLVAPADSGMGMWGDLNERQRPPREDQLHTSGTHSDLVNPNS